MQSEIDCIENNLNDKQNANLIATADNGECACSNGQMQNQKRTRTHTTIEFTHPVQ